MSRWTKKAADTEDIREGLEKLPQDVAKAPKGTDAEQVEPKTPDNDDVPLPAEPEDHK